MSSSAEQLGSPLVGGALSGAEHQREAAGVYGMSWTPEAAGLLGLVIRAIRFFLVSGEQLQRRQARQRSGGQALRFAGSWEQT
jgi:hypothetical protein